MVGRGSGGLSDGSDYFHMERLSYTISKIREHSRAWLRLLLILATLIFLFFVAGGGVSHNAKWQILNINISGANTVSEDDIRALALQKLQGNYFLVYARDNSHLFPKKEIEEALLNTFPRLLNVSANRTDDHSISISVTERKPYALWCGETFHPELSSFPQCWFIDGTGFVFDKAPVFSRGVYIEVYGKLIVKNEESPLESNLPYDEFVMANNFAKLLLQSVGKPVQMEINPDDELSITIQLSAQYPFLADVVIKFKAESVPETLINNLQAAIPVQFPDNVALKKKLSYIDMRFGNKVIFGFEQ